MANIGTFTKTENGFVGEIVTLTFQAKNVRLVPEATGTDNAPSHRAYVGRADYAYLVPRPQGHRRLSRPSRASSEQSGGAS